MRKITGEEKTQIFLNSLITVLRCVWPTLLMFRIQKFVNEVNLKLNRLILAHVCHLSLYEYGYTCLYFSKRLHDSQTYCVRNGH